MPTFDTYINKLTNSSNVKNVGICTTYGMDYREVKRLIAKINISCPQITITIRPHPGTETIDLYSEVITQYDLQTSDSKKENSCQWNFKSYGSDNAQ